LPASVKIGTKGPDRDFQIWCSAVKITLLPVGGCTGIPAVLPVERLAVKSILTHT
jgi:hypothetical protein